MCSPKLISVHIPCRSMLYKLCWAVAKMQGMVLLAVLLRCGVMELQSAFCLNLLTYSGRKLSFKIQLSVYTTVLSYDLY